MIPALEGKGNGGQLDPHSKSQTSQNYMIRPCLKTIRFCTFGIGNVPSKIEKALKHKRLIWVILKLNLCLAIKKVGWGRGLERLLIPEEYLILLKGADLGIHNYL